MIEKLHLYLNELEAKRVEVLNTDNTEAINAEINAYADEVIKRYANEKDAKLAKIDSDINCVKGIIARETEIAAETADTVTE